MDSFLNSSILKDYRVMLKKVLRFKPHVLPEESEKILAMQSEAIRPR